MPRKAKPSTAATMWAALDKAERVETRICFAISWFRDEELANQAAKAVRAHGQTYNGGWFHGMPCGRDRSFDTADEKGELYAVTH